MRKIDKEAMKLAYIEMGAINLTLSQEDFHLETEGANLGYDKLGGTEAESQAN